MPQEAPSPNPFEKLDALFARSVHARQWQQAVQARAQAAQMARLRGLISDAFRYFEEAIDLAGAHDLERLELQQRLQRFRLLMSSDRTGRLQTQLAADLAWSIWPTKLSGPLVEKLEAYGSAAIAAFDEFLRGESGLPSDLDEALYRARRKALAFSLLYLAAQFEEAREQLKARDAAVAGRVSAAAAQARAEVAAVCDSFRAEALQLAAEYEHNRGNFETRDELLDSAEQAARQLPETLVNLYLARAGYASGDEAFGYARRALEESERTSAAPLKAQAAAKVRELLAGAGGEEDGRPPEVQGAGATEKVAEILNGSAYRALQGGRFDEAVQQIGRALQYASTLQLERMALRLRALPLYELGRFDEAEADIDGCVALLSAELDRDYRSDAELFDDRIAEEENLYLMKALLRAKARRHREAWDAAEQGRSGRLKREIGGDFRRWSAYDATREWLHANRAAMVSFGFTRWGTLVLTAGPDDAEPQSHILNLAAKDLLSGSAVGKDDAILGWIPELSTKLIHPLSSRLVEITHSARVLYVVPDSALYCAPFAALTLEPSAAGRMLIDLCPLAIAPSAAVLLSHVSSSRSGRERDCLALAVGESGGVDFRDDLPTVTSAPWPKPPAQLTGDAATPDRFAAEARSHSVLFVSCHGALASGKELMTASQLVLAGGTLSARDVLGWRIDADLVFLSACVAGRFLSAARSDVTGFVKAFMRAGARSLIAPLIRVDPAIARDIAAAFFNAWLGGATKAEALQQAQIKASKKYQDKGWATFWLFWDFV